MAMLTRVTDTLVTCKNQITGAIHRLLESRLSDTISVKDFGALGDGTGALLSTKYSSLAEAQVVYPHVTSLDIPIDTAAIDAAWLAVRNRSNFYFAQHPVGESILYWAALSCPELYFPDGRYVYYGDGLAITDRDTQGAAMKLRGAGKSSTEIQLGSDGLDNSFVNSPENPYHLSISGFKINGGKDQVKFTSVKQNQTQVSRVEDNYFSAYRGCGLGFSSQDWPNLKVIRNQFYNRTGTKSIGLMICGWSAGLEVIGNEFGLAEGAGVYSYAIKITVAEADAGGYRGPATPSLLDTNSIYRRNNVGGSASIWIVPNPATPDNSGRALVFRNNKLGAENLNTNSYHFLIADEADEGTWGGDRRHSTAKSTAYLRGVIFDKNNVRFEPDATQPYIASFTPHLQEMSYQDIIDNTMPVNYLEYRGGMVYTDFVAADYSSIVDTRFWNITTAPNYSGKPVAAVTNFPATVRVIDERGLINTSASIPEFRVGDVAYANVMSDPNGVVNSGSRTLVNDSLGLTRASELTFTANFGRISYALSGYQTGRPLWIEIELTRSGATPLNSVTVELVESETIKFFSRAYSVTSETRIIRVPVILPAGTTAATLRVVATGYDATHSTVRVGRAAAYHAVEPIPYGHIRCVGFAWNEPHLVMGIHHCWINSAGKWMRKSGQPTSDTDGAPMS